MHESEGSDLQKDERQRNCDNQLWWQQTISKIATIK